MNDRAALRHLRERVTTPDAPAGISDLFELVRGVGTAFPFPVHIVDEDAEILYMNDEMKRLVGKDAVGLRCWETYRDDMCWAEECPLKSPFPEGCAGLFEVDRAMGGRAFRIHHTGVTFHGKKALLEVFIDVTDEKHQAARAKQQASELAAIVEAWPAALAVIEQGRIIRTNLAMQQLLGHSEAEILSGTFQRTTRLVGRDGRERQLDATVGWAGVIASRGEMKNKEVGIVRADGSVRWCLISSTRTADDRERVVVAARDVTELRATEAAVAQIREESDLRFRTALEALPMAVWLFDGDRMLLTNDAAMRITGYSREEIQAPGHLARVMHPDDRVAVEQRAQARLSGEAVESTYTTRIIRKDGTVRTLRASATPVQLGTRTVTLISAEDVTERAAADLEREQLRLQLARSQQLEAVGRLAGGVAHDFNNMLTAILGYSEIAIRKLNPGHALRDDLEEIHKAGTRSASLTRQLLAFARRQPATPMEIDLNEAVRSMVSLLRPAIGEDVTLLWSPGEQLDWISIDPSQIDQIIANLCVNARDAIQGTGTLTITTRVEVVDAEFCAAHPSTLPGRYVVLSVADTGAGMTPDTLAQIFEPFFTTKPPGQGTGLGLSTVYGIVAQNRGAIVVDSAPGRGSTFEVYLPAVAPPRDASDQCEAGALAQRTGERILLVEDEPSVLRLTESMLDGLGYRVMSAGSPEAGRQISAEDLARIDLLLSDVIMPETNGVELYRELRRRRPDLRCLFMSGYAADATRNSEELDVLRMIQKPFTMSELDAAIRAALEDGPPDR